MQSRARGSSKDKYIPVCPQRSQAHLGQGPEVVLELLSSASAQGFATRWTKPSFISLTQFPSYPIRLFPLHQKKTHWKREFFLTIYIVYHYLALNCMACSPLWIVYSWQTAASRNARDFLAPKPSHWQHRQNRTMYFKLLKHGSHLCNRELIQLLQ